MKQLIAALFATSAMVIVPFVSAHPQEQTHDEPAIENAPADTDEPSLDELLGLDDEGDEKPDEEPTTPDPPAENGEDVDPELSRELDKRLSGEQAAEQFVQAIQEMEEVAIRLGDEADAGIDTQRMQDEIILKLEQIISSAQKQQSQQQQQQQGGEPKPGQPRQADRGGQPKPGEQPGQQPGEQPGEKPGEGQGEKPGEGQGEKPGEGQGEKPGEGQGEKPGEGQGEQPGQQANGQSNNPSNGNASQGSVRNEDLSMKELREGEWGNLPPRLRDELAESLSETFNPVYRAATEAFYRRIAELSQQEAEGGQ